MALFVVNLTQKSRKKTTYAYLKELSVVALQFE
jgi:hypothetical protein